jgi:hypothetical protein
MKNLILILAVSLWAQVGLGQKSNSIFNQAVKHALQKEQFKGSSTFSPVKGNAPIGAVKAGNSKAATSALNAPVPADRVSKGSRAPDENGSKGVQPSKFNVDGNAVPNKGQSTESK